MKNFISRFYARERLGRALVITGLVGIASVYLSMLLPVLGSIFILFVYYPAIFTVIAGVIVGITNLAKKTTPTPTPDTDAATPEGDDSATPATPTYGRFTGRIIAGSGLLLMFSPLALAILNTQPGHNWMSEGDSGSGGAAIWLMLLTIPLGSAVIFTGAIIGLVRIAKKK